MAAVYSEVKTASARTVMAAALRRDRHYRVVWHGLLDSDLLSIGSAAEGVRHEIPSKTGTQKLRLPRFVAEVLGKREMDLLMGVMLFDFDGTEDCGFLAVEREADAEALAKALANSARQAAASEQTGFGYISLEIEAAEWNTPVDAPLYLPEGGKLLFALQLKKVNGEPRIVQRAPRVAEDETPVAGEVEESEWSC